MNFTWNGEWCRETLSIAPTPPNHRYAVRLVKEINEKISAGTFKYGDYFPKSKRAEKSPGTETLSNVGSRWLKTRGRLSSGTKEQYTNALQFWYREIGGDRAVESITHGELASFIGSYEWPSAKLCNNRMIALRGLFNLARRDRLILDNPMEGIQNTKMQAPLPDPFTLEEADAIIADMFKHYDERVGNYFEFAFYTGERPEEIVGHLWGDIDWNLEMIRVQRAKSFRGEVKEVKNHSARDIELSSRAIAALQRQKVYTHHKQHGHIFENPVTNEPWHDPRSPRRAYWIPTLDRLGIRYRGPYHTRHTYATAAIMQGCKPVWIAKQLGNSPLMIFKHYAKWLEKADKSQEKNKFEGAIGVPNN